MSDNLELAANAYFEQLTANRQSIFSGSRGGNYMTSPDTKHPQCWSDYGYPLAPDFKTFFTMYSKTSLGFAGVETTVDKCWQTPPWVRTTENNKEKYNALEIAFDNWANDLDLWTNIRQLDQRQRVGRYAGLMMIIADDKEPSEPVEGVLSPDDIVKVMPLYESQLEVLDVYQDKKKPNYGMPKTYEYDECAVGGDNEDTNASYTVHESRVIIWAEGASGNSIYGKSILEPGLHNLLNLDKIGGAGGEGLWKNARTPMEIVMSEKADAHALAQIYGCEPKDLPKKISDKIKKFNEGLDNSIISKGFEMKPLNVSLPNPKDWLDDQKQQFAASVKTPLTILIGNQSGNQASRENGSSFDETCESRRSNEISRFIKRDLFGWLKRFKVFAGLDKVKLYVHWDPLVDQSMSDKLDGALKMADVIQKLMGTGMVSPFTEDEIRMVVGLDPLTEREEYENEQDEE